MEVEINIVCTKYVIDKMFHIMMTSSNGSIFRVSGPLHGEFTGHRWIPLTKASDAQLWSFRWSAPWINCWVNNCEAGDLRRHHAHYDVTVMWMRLGCRKRVISIGDAYMHQWTGSGWYQLVQSMLVTYLVSSHYPNQCWLVNWSTRNTIQWNLTVICIQVQ